MKTKNEKTYNVILATCLTAYILLIFDYYFLSIFGATTIEMIQFPALFGICICAGFAFYHIYRRIRFKEYNWFLLSPLPADLFFLLLFVLMYFVPPHFPSNI